jgi:hypothetical protein
MKEAVNFQISPGFIEEKEPLIVWEFEGDVHIRIDGDWGTRDYIANISKNEGIRISIIKKDEIK